MLARCLSASLQGLEARPVTVEVDLAPGLPGVQLVGLPDKAIQESRERVRSALRNSGFRGPLVRVVINLAPADERKEGPSFDLPIALALLVASGQLDAPLLDGLWCAGELGLDGRLRPCRGVIAIAELAARKGAKALLVPPDNAIEAALIPTLTVRTAQGLRELVDELQQRRPGLTVSPASQPAKAISGISPDLPDSETGSQALALAAAGGHHLLLVGPPGCGKTRLAQSLPGLLPPLESNEALTVTKIHSVAGMLSQPADLQRQRPFRAPHHRCTAAALLGGGLHPMPGELSLAHAGVLFLDEMAEFPRSVLDQLRQPLEEGQIRLSTARRRATFPCSITLVAATNPCPCGWHGDSRHACRCTESQRRRYWQRLSGPLLDRIDLQLRLERPTARCIRATIASEPATNSGSRWISANRIESARERMRKRNPKGCSNKQLSAKQLGDRGGFQPESLRLWEHIVEKRSLSTRSGLQLLRVARTIADLDQMETVPDEAIAQASFFRCADLLIPASSY